jgi:hypothetical protein
MEENVLTKRKDVTGLWRILPNDEFHDCALLSIKLCSADQVEED